MLRPCQCTRSSMGSLCSSGWIGRVFPIKRKEFLGGFPFCPTASAVSECLFFPFIWIVLQRSAACNRRLVIKIVGSSSSDTPQSSVVPNIFYFGVLLAASARILIMMLMCDVRGLYRNLWGIGFSSRSAGLSSYRYTYFVVVGRRRSRGGEVSTTTTTIHCRWWW